jgi:hypothetical protein
VSAVELTAHLEARGSGGSGRGPAPAETISALALRVRGEYAEMRGLRLTVLQAARDCSASRQTWRTPSSTSCAAPRC